tara:strand:- start:488 stop:1006 length:519 start_codon:yes stop_codon:yes gene_type:complete
MKRNGFTLIELLVVVAIIGILAAVGTVAYNGYTLGAKVNATKAQYKTVVKHQIGEITKCQLGMIEKIGHPGYNPKPCPLRWGGANEWNVSMGSQCRNPGGAFYEWRNPYNNHNKPGYACNTGMGGRLEKDEVVGEILYEQISDTVISIAVCWKTPCSSPENRLETIIDISDY